MDKECAYWKVKLRDFLKKKVCPTKTENVMLSKHYNNSYEHATKNIKEGLTCIWPLLMQGSSEKIRMQSEGM